MIVNRAAPAGMLSGRVLVVEDHAFNRRAIEMQLGRWGVSCVAVASTEEALGVLQRQHFDLLIIDLHLPGMSGTQLAGRVRDVSSIPLVLLTGREDMRHAAATAGSPFDAVLIKESRFDALHACLWQLLPRAATGPLARGRFGIDLRLQRTRRAREPWSRRAGACARLASRAR